MVVYKDGYKLESTRGTNTLSDFIELACFKNGTKMPIEPSFTCEYNSLESVGSDLGITKGNHPLDRVSINNQIALDEVSFYLMLGNYEEIENEMVITFSGGNKPSATFYHLMNNRAWVGYGCVIESLDFDFNFGKALSFNYSAKGMSQSIVTNDLTLTQPADTDVYDTLSLLTFNGATYDLATIGGKFQQQLEPLLGQAGYYQSITDTSKVTCVLQVLFKPNLDLSALYTLLVAGTDTTHAIEFTLSSSSNPTGKYIRFEANALLYDIVMNTDAGKADQHIGLFVCDGTVKLSCKGGALT